MGSSLLLRARGSDSPSPSDSRGHAPHVGIGLLEVVVVVLVDTVDREEIIARVAALDVGKAELVCCVRVPGKGPG